MERGLLPMRGSGVATSGELCADATQLAQIEHGVKMENEATELPGLGDCNLKVGSEIEISVGTRHRVQIPHQAARAQDGLGRDHSDGSIGTGSFRDITHVESVHIAPEAHLVMGAD
eukprot:CAMPEP_0181218126 /NCGR_PEP_ID=MMETSP1096-20121128/27523_1 /TAXON_ID=156174 ORGANISM="Chrysochromulina ericina, Strain CCMP281" /NCGR_SAMPLE_ID=MMETSP1096 /ASSEMBLY_ACC=CAM_ASM_000453 /LENGTH=115 /DNA_ID=CAMNT_0023310313 /DNA_START=789 /DNA_END=1136 /DNA_ORIENTATION=-